MKDVCNEKRARFVVIGGKESEKKEKRNERMDFRRCWIGSIPCLIPAQTKTLTNIKPSKMCQKKEVKTAKKKEKRASKASQSFEEHKARHFFLFRRLTDRWAAREVCQAVAPYACKVSTHLRNTSIHGRRRNFVFERSVGVFVKTRDETISYSITQGQRWVNQPITAVDRHVSSRTGRKYLSPNRYTVTTSMC